MVKKKKQQSSVSNFFQKASSDSGSSKKKKPKYRLHTTRVKKAYDGGFREGHLVELLDDPTASYRIKWHDDDTTDENADDVWTEPQVEEGVELQKALSDGLCMAKHFDESLYEGKVVTAWRQEDSKLYFRVKYEDDDEEDMDSNELKEAQKLWKQTSKKKKKRKVPNATTERKTQTKKPKSSNVAPPESTSDIKNGRRSRTKVRYVQDDSDIEEDDEPIPKKRAKKTSKKPQTLHDDSDFDDFGGSDSSDDELDADMLEASEEEDSEEEELQPKSRSKSKKAAPAPKRTTKKSLKTFSSQQVQKEFQTKLEKDLKAEKPKNNPQKLPAQPYVDPVGVDPTNGIVEGIVGAQVRKIGDLLLSAIKQKPSDTSKDLAFPIQLQTACSGTDAPSIALGLVKESLDKLLPTHSHGFDYSHEMSCEIEPFKQAYIGRNFPGVPLFPDITKLTSGPKVLDVYGREQSIPDGNFFVAGTSCKDFSMLKTRDRLDIEDKGTSGETFLAAVEFLDQKQPPVAIFENVDGAPWEKMQEYIRGRLKLEKRNDTKAIKDSKGKADADNLLIFSVNENGRYVAEEIPRQVGIRAGAVVEGFVSEGCNAKDVTLIEAPPEWEGKRKITLGQMAKKHGIDLNADTLVLEKKVRYCTHLCKVDTKNYGLPQTRNRKYLFIWRSDDPDDDLGDYFQEILDHLKTPLLHSMDAFLLPDTHDRIRCFREALRSGPGLLVHRERAKELDFWNFEESRIKDVTCHLAFRSANGIDERSRYLTGWDTRGRKLLAPTCWPELFDCWNMRRLDMIDCFGAAAGKFSGMCCKNFVVGNAFPISQKISLFFAVRDSISRDPLHHSFTWDISQVRCCLCLV